MQYKISNLYFLKLIAPRDHIVLVLVLSLSSRYQSLVFTEVVKSNKYKYWH